LALEVRSLAYEVRILASWIRKIAAAVKVLVPGVVIGKYLQSDLERDVVLAFLHRSPRQTPELAEKLDTYPKKVLRAIKRINRRVSKREGLDVFRFDPTSRAWSLDLEIVDRKELIFG